MATPPTTFSDGMYQISESLQTLNEFNAEDILNIKQEDPGSSSDYYSLEPSPSSGNYLEAATPEFYNNPMIFDPNTSYFQNNNYSKSKYSFLFYSPANFKKIALPNDIHNNNKSKTFKKNIRTFGVELCQKIKYPLLD